MSTGGDLALIITAGSTLLTALGGGAAFVWAKIEQRFKEIERRLTECQERDKKSGERRVLERSVINFLLDALEAVSPFDRAIGQARELLGEAEQIDHTARVQLIDEQDRDRKNITRS